MKNKNKFPNIHRAVSPRPEKKKNQGSQRNVVENDRVFLRVSCYFFRAFFKYKFSDVLHKFSQNKLFIISMSSS